MREPKIERPKGRYKERNIDFEDQEFPMNDIPEIKIKWYDKVNLWISEHKGNIGLGLLAVSETIKETKPGLAWLLTIISSLLSKQKTAKEKTKSFWYKLIDFVKSIINYLKGKKDE